jgi:folate-binding Fe-S cluster repair protein YgfZ
MSHTANMSNGTIIHYNSDLSGDFDIINKNGDRIEVDGNDIVEFVSNQLKDKILSDIGDIDIFKVLEFLKNL